MQPTITHIVITAFVTAFAFSLFAQPNQTSPAHFGNVPVSVELPAVASKPDYARETLGADPIDTDKDLNYILYRYGRMELIGKGIWLAPAVPVPPCDDTVRGLVWFLKDDKGDALLICMQTPSGQAEWQSF